MAAARLLTAFIIALTLTQAGGCRDDGFERVTIANETFDMELALTEEQRTRGMGGRESFPEGGGMLFVFAESEPRAFWMYDCLIDIDVIFLDGRGVVTAAHRMAAEPPRRDDESEQDYQNRLRHYSSRRPAQFAIELPAGSIERLGVRVDDRIELDVKRLKRLAARADESN
jgi:uncharacterized protein